MRTSSYVGCYGGPNAYATNVNESNTAGVITFINPIPNGGTDYFSLEEAVQLTASGVGIPVGGTTVPEPVSLALLGSAVVGFSFAGRIRQLAAVQCGVRGGVPASTECHSAKNDVRLRAVWTGTRRNRLRVIGVCLHFG